MLKQLELVQLEASAAARANTLSGGMQRRLSVAVSLVGDPQIVLLGAGLCAAATATATRARCALTPRRGPQTSRPPGWTR